MIRVNKTFVLSDESVNSYKFKVLTTGIDLRRFLKNPIMLRNHAGESIGFWENIRVENGKLLAEPVFSSTTALAKETADKVKEGTLRAASMGVEDAVFSFDAKYSDPKAENGTVINCLISEASIVDFPANENAITLYDKKKGKIDLSHDLSDYTKSNLFTNRNKLKMTKETLELLGLTENSNTTDVHNAIVKLMQEKQSLETVNLSLFADRNHAVVESAVSSGKISFAQAEHYKLLLSKDFNSTKSLLDSIEVPESKKITKDIKVSDLIQLRKSQEENKEDSSEAPKDKSKWNLEHYRKFAPKELQKDPALYKRLLSRKEN